MLGKSAPALADVLLTQKIDCPAAFAVSNRAYDEWQAVKRGQSASHRLLLIPINLLWTALLQAQVMGKALELLCGNSGFLHFGPSLSDKR